MSIHLGVKLAKDIRRPDALQSPWVCTLLIPEQLHLSFGECSWRCICGFLPASVARCREIYTAKIALGSDY